MAEEREVARRLLDEVPDNRLMYVIGFLEGALIPEEKDSFYSDDNQHRLKESLRQMETVGGTVHDISKRIGIAEEMFDVPENFDEYNDEIADMFESAVI